MDVYTIYMYNCEIKAFNATSSKPVLIELSDIVSFDGVFIFGYSMHTSSVESDFRL